MSEQAPKTLEFKEFKILEGTVAWAKQNIIDHLKTKKLPETYDDLFQTWQAALCLDERDFADQCSDAMDKLLISNGVQSRPRVKARIKSVKTKTTHS